MRCLFACTAYLHVLHLRLTKCVTPLIITLQQQDPPSPGYPSSSYNQNASELRAAPYGSRTHVNGAYEQDSCYPEHSHNPNHPDDSDYPNLTTSHNFSQSQEGLVLVNTFHY